MPRELVGALNALAGTTGQEAAGAANAAVARFAGYPAWTYQEVTEDVTLEAVNRVVGCSTSGVTVTIPTSSVGAGAWLVVKDESGNAGTIGQNISIETEGSETIDGASAVVLNANYEGVVIYSNGTDWFTASAIGTIL